MTTPTNARELLTHLREHPRVRTSCDDPRIPVGDRTFARHADGGLWLAKPDGGEEYVPIDFGLTNAETGLEFRPGGFTLLAIRFDYLDWTGPQVAEAPEELREEARP